MLEHKGNRDRVNVHVESNVMAILNAATEEQIGDTRWLLSHSYLKNKDLNFFTTSFMRNILVFKNFDLKDVYYKKCLLEIKKKGAGPDSKLVKRCIQAFSENAEHTQEILDYAEKCCVDFKENVENKIIEREKAVKQSKMDAERIKQERCDNTRYFASEECIFNVIKYYKKSFRGQRRGRDVRKFEYARRALKVFESRLEGDAKFMIQRALRKRNKVYLTDVELRFVASEVYAQNVWFYKGDFSLSDSSEKPE